MKFRVQATLPLPADVYFLERDSAAFRALLARVRVTEKKRRQRRRSKEGSLGLSLRRTTVKGSCFLFFDDLKKKNQQKKKIKKLN